MIPYSNSLIVQTKFAKLLPKKKKTPGGYYEMLPCEVFLGQKKLGNAFLE